MTRPSATMPVIVAPRGELRLRSLEGDPGWPDGELSRDDVGDRVEVGGLREERLDDEILDALVDDGGRGGTAADGVLDAAAVAPVFRGPAHRVPAARAPKQACEQARRPDLARVTRGVRREERHRIDERLVRTLEDDALARARLAEVDTVGEQPADRLADPASPRSSSARQRCSAARRA